MITLKKYFLLILSTLFLISISSCGSDDVLDENTPEYYSTSSDSGSSPSCMKEWWDIFFRSRLKVKTELSDTKKVELSHSRITMYSHEVEEELCRPISNYNQLLKMYTERKICGSNEYGEYTSNPASAKGEISSKIIYYQEMTLEHFMSPEFVNDWPCYDEFSLDDLSYEYGDYFTVYYTTTIEPVNDDSIQLFRPCDEWEANMIAKIGMYNIDERRFYEKDVKVGDPVNYYNYNRDPEKNYKSYLGLKFHVENNKIHLNPILYDFANGIPGRK